MYEDNNVTYRLGINWFDILVKVILLIVFVVILVILFPKADLDVFYDSIYTNNINTMKDAARNYYTVDRLPETVGDTTSMSLKEMIDNHMIIRFKDKDEKYCDEVNSGVEVTKTSDNSYVLKVNLNCGEQKDFILETIGCTTVCSNGTCTVVTGNGGSTDVATKEEEETGSTGGDVKNPGGVYVTKVTLYQHKQLVTSTSTVYTCPEGYLLSGSTCTKSTTGATIDATPVYGPDKIVSTGAKYNDGGYKKVYTDPEKRKVSTDYSCPSGYILNGGYCIKYIDATEVAGDTQYTCPTGYTKNGTKCNKVYDATYNNGNTSYTCPNGGTLSNGKCTITTSANTSYSCPSGYDRNGTSCYKVYNATANTSNGYYTCPNGGTLSNGKCYVTSSSSYNATYSYGSWYSTGTKYYTKTISVYTHDTEKVVFNGAVSGAVCGSPCGNKGVWYKYTYYARKGTYSCPNGGTLSGSKCNTTSTSSYNATYHKGTTSYSCPNGGTLSNGKCTLTATATVNYSCPSGYDRNGTSCYKVYNATANTSNGYYTCPNGGTLNGSKCTITIDATKTQKPSTYTCPTGYTLSGKTCYKKIFADETPVYEYTCPSGYTKATENNKTVCYKYEKATGTYYCEDSSAVLDLENKKCNKTVKGDITGYTCPTDYTLSGDKCTKYTNDVINATATTKTYTSYRYTWSEKSYLEGWIFTGETKTQEQTYTAGQK